MLERSWSDFIRNFKIYYVLESQIIKDKYVLTGEKKSVSLGIIFSKRPENNNRMKFIENLFWEDGITVVWDDESVEECKKRNERL